MYLLFDIGGTKLRLANSVDGKNISEPYIVDTPKEFDQAITFFKGVYKKEVELNQIDAVIGGVPGVLDPKSQMLLKVPHLPVWEGKALATKLTEIFHAPCYLENDAVLAALGEANFGAGKDYKIVAYLTISTGIGGARIVNKKIDEKTLGFEPGNQILDFEKLLTFEDLVSGTGLEKRFGKKTEEIVDEKIWDEAHKLLAVGLNNVIVHWSPEVIVLGGGIMDSPHISIEKIQENLKNIMKIFPEIPPIKRTSLGDLAGLYGALHYGKLKGKG